LAVLVRLKPNWAAVTLSDAAASQNIKPERLSRLCSRAIERFEKVIAAFTRVGRPTADPQEQKDANELRLSGALLEVASSLLAQVSARCGVWRALVTGAWLRLHGQYPSLTQKRFCETLTIPTRTLRHWLTSAPSTPAQLSANKPTESKRRKRPNRRGRFGFDVTLPNLQTAADTTDIKAFGVRLKLVAAQDVGGRDQNLFDAVIIDDHESAEIVARVLGEALAGREGSQVITDQGTPYLAKKTREALDELGAEHAPQREGDPIAKATIERAFGTVKQIARPILSITERIAQAVPLLRDTQLAKAAATLLLTALLRAYQAGARAARRADEARQGVTNTNIERVVEEQREKARADDNSARLLLKHIHDAYGIGKPLFSFVRTFRRFPLPVLREAERLFAEQAHRDDIRNRAAYFGKLVRICHDTFRQQRARGRQARAKAEELDVDIRCAETRQQKWHDDPAGWLRHALETIAVQWSCERGDFLSGEVGPATPGLTPALERLSEVHGPVAGFDVVASVVREFQHQYHDRLGERGVRAVSAICREKAAAVFTSADPPATFAAIGSKLRPTPPNHLRT
jgi:transposase InsO family protein